MTTLTHLECSLCARHYPAGQVHNLCACGGPLLARYDLAAARQSWSREWILSGPSSMWRYAPVLPVDKPASMITLGEGWTPLIRSQRLRPAPVAPKTSGSRTTASTPPAPSRPAACPAAFRCAIELGVTKIALALGRQRRQRRCCVRRRGRHRSAHLHAARRPASQLHRVQGLRRPRHPGRRPHLRLRPDRRRAQGRRRLVRRQHAQGALPHRRQEDHGLRNRRAVPLDPARRDPLSHRRRRRSDRHVESLR